MTLVQGHRLPLVRYQTQGYPTQGSITKYFALALRLAGVLSGAPLIPVNSRWIGRHRGGQVLGLTMPNRATRPWILPAVWQIAPPLPGFIMTPQQHRRRAQDLRDAGRPDLAQNHENCARIIEHRRARMH